MTITETKQRTITLTGRPPVRIKEADWPIIATAEAHNGVTHRRSELFLRQHADGRSLLYGRFTTGGQSETTRRAGELLTASDDIPTAARRVAETLGFGDERLVNALLADMPPEPLE